MSTAVATGRKIVRTVSEESAISISNDISLLSPTEKAHLKQKNERISIASGVSIISGLPAAALTVVSVAALHGWTGPIEEVLMAGAIPMALSLGLHFTLEHLGRRCDDILYRDKEAREKRDALQSRVEFEAWRKTTTESLRERFAVDLTVEEFDKLRYPRELPTAEKTIRYGSIDKYLSLEDGSGALQQVTLIWAEGEMKLLTTRLTELGITR